MGYNPAVYYPTTYEVVGSQTGPHLTQQRIAVALREVLDEKGLTSSSTPGVVFYLTWRNADGPCDPFDANTDKSCLSTGRTGPGTVAGWLHLEAIVPDARLPFWVADFTGLRTVPIEPPSQITISKLLVPAFREALAAYPDGR